LTATSRCASSIVQLSGEGHSASPVTAVR
jgi:hypothetical protein